MKRLSVWVLCSIALGGCGALKAPGSWFNKPEPVVAAPLKAATPGLVDANGAPIERIAFVSGVSSATVERMAKLQGCTGGAGAGLVTPAGPVEVYRMQCDSGKMFLARCELRQCKPMR